MDRRPQGVGRLLGVSILLTLGRLRPLRTDGAYGHAAAENDLGEPGPQPLHRWVLAGEPRAVAARFAHPLRSIGSSRGKGRRCPRAGSGASILGCSIRTGVHWEAPA